MSECERCNGDGEIDGDIETVPCPNCRDVCQWCNSPYDDGEPLGGTGLSVCRECIRDMATYKEDVSRQLFVSNGFENILDDPAQFREDLGTALDDVYEEYGFNRPTDGWHVRLPDE